MGLFKKKVLPMELSQPATIILTCNSLPTHEKATYWFEVLLNYKPIGRVEQNGVPSTYTTTLDKNVLGLVMIMKENTGKITELGGRNQNLELKAEETVSVVFENRKFFVNGNKQ